MLGHCQRAQQPMIATAIRQVFGAASGEEARARLAEVVDRLEGPAPKVARLLLEAESDVLAFYAFRRSTGRSCAARTRSERVNREIGRRTDVVGIFPNEQALLRLAGSLLIEQNDDWLVSRRYLSQESLSAVLDLGTEQDGEEDRKEVRALSAA